ncbi:hypothetical protein [Neptunicella sp.]|uniref:hypothetical protein n=1 Tax=Neptunicella sp. TaxID=2125986 RepID=UPI003F68E3BE
MLSSVAELTQDSVQLLIKRGLTTDQVGDFEALLQQAQHQLQTESQSAKQILRQMSADDLAVLQKAACLAKPININSLSNEGAQNLLAQPDHSNMVDLNNDGLVEIGEGKTMIFPPVNAPASVKAAWEKATNGMSESDKMMAELNMHLAVYGAYIDGVSAKPAVPPDQQWSTSGWQELMEQVRSGLDFAVSMDGWTEHNKMLKGFYARFEQELSSSSNMV